MLTVGDRVRVDYPEGGSDWHGRTGRVTRVDPASRWPYRVLIDAPCPRGSGVFAAAELRLLEKAATVRPRDI